MIETKIYVGLNDSRTQKQKYRTSSYREVLKDVCRKYHVPFSLSVNEGGYYYEDGTYTEETSLILSLIDAEQEVIEKIARDLCVFFNQESVMITEDVVRTFFINQDRTGE